MTEKNNEGKIAGVETRVNALENEVRNAMPRLDYAERTAMDHNRVLDNIQVANVNLRHVAQYQSCNLSPMSDMVATTSRTDSIQNQLDTVLRNSLSEVIHAMSPEELVEYISNDNSDPLNIRLIYHLSKRNSKINTILETNKEVWNRHLKRLAMEETLKK